MNKVHIDRRALHRKLKVIGLISNSAACCFIVTT